MKGLKMKKLILIKKFSKISTLSSGKIDQYEYFTVEKAYFSTKVDLQNKLDLLFLNLENNM